MAFKDRLKEARLNNNMTQEQIAEKVGVAKSTFTGYEKGNSEPNMLTISKIMNVLKVDANFLWQDEMEELGGNPTKLKYDEIEHIKKYRFILEHSPDGAKMVNAILNREYAIAEQSQKQTARIKELETINALPPAPRRIYTYLHKIAAAGTGFYFDDIPTDTIEAPYLENADFIVGVNGDSMEPTYSNGDLVYVEKRQIVEPGEIGIFIVNGECFIKEAGDDGLISHNKKYKTIPGTEHIICVGRVLGKVNWDETASAF